MPTNSRWDLIQPLKGQSNLRSLRSESVYSSFTSDFITSYPAVQAPISWRRIAK